MTNEIAIAAATWNSDAPRWPRSRQLVTNDQSRHATWTGLGSR